MNEIWSFLTLDRTGLVILAIITGITTNAIYALLKHFCKKSRHKFNKYIFKRNLVKIATSFCQGSRAQYAKQGTTFQQALLVGEYIIETIIQVTWIISILLLTIICLLVLYSNLFWLPIIISSAILTVRIKIFKRHLMYFKQTFTLGFGEKYFEDEQIGYTQYWDKLFKKK